MNNEAKVGAFVLAGLALLGVTIFLLGDVTFEKRYPLSVTFTEVSGLPDRAVVKLSGVEVGNVKEILLEEGRVRVNLSIREGVQVYRDSIFRVGSTSVIGSKYLEISQGKKSAGIFAPGETAVGEDSVPLERAVTQALQSVQKVLHEVSDEGRLGRNINASVENVREMTVTLNELIAELKPHLTKTAENAELASARLDRVLARAEEIADKADQILAKVNSSTGTVGALISDSEMKDDVKASVKDLRTTMASGSQRLL
jgi:phospholipid/cholesterol/gamma-HCH transport system substrate-binding protein